VHDFNFSRISYLVDVKYSKVFASTASLTLISYLLWPLPCAFCIILSSVSHSRPYLTFTWGHAWSRR